MGARGDAQRRVDEHDHRAARRLPSRSSSSLASRGRSRGGCVPRPRPPAGQGRPARSAASRCPEPPWAAVGPASKPIATGPTSAASTSDPATTPSATVASAPARASSARPIATSAARCPTATRPSRISEPKWRARGPRAAGASTISGATDRSAIEVAARERSASRSSTSADPECGRQDTAAPAARSERPATALEGTSSASAAASSVKGGSGRTRAARLAGWSLSAGDISRPGCGW